MTRKRNIERLRLMAERAKNREARAWTNYTNARKWREKVYGRLAIAEEEATMAAGGSKP